MRATSEKSSSVWLSLPALMRPQNSSIVGQRLRLAEEGVGLGEQLVLDADAGDAALRRACATRRRTLLKLP